MIPSSTGGSFSSILVSEADATQRYTGITQDLPSRLNDHNQGTCIYTARCRPWRIESAIAFRSEAKARSFEKYLKRHLRRLI